MGSSDRRRFPDNPSSRRRGRPSGQGSEYQWLIDPLDGTTNFMQGLPVYCVSVACRRGDELLVGVIDDPEGGNLFTATKGGGAFWNGRRIEVPPRAGLDGAFLATGYPFRALSTLDVYLSVFRDVFQHARRSAAAARAPSTSPTPRPGIRRLLRVPPLPLGHRRGIILIQEARRRSDDLDGGDRYFKAGTSWPRAGGAEGAAGDREAPRQRSRDRPPQPIRAPSLGQRRLWGTGAGWSLEVPRSIRATSGSASAISPVAVQGQRPCIAALLLRPLRHPGRGGGARGHRRDAEPPRSIRPGGRAGEPGGEAEGAGAAARARSGARQRLASPGQGPPVYACGAPGRRRRSVAQIAQAEVSAALPDSITPGPPARDRLRARIREELGGPTPPGAAAGVERDSPDRVRATRPSARCAARSSSPLLPQPAEPVHQGARCSPRARQSRLRPARPSMPTADGGRRFPASSRWDEPHRWRYGHLVRSRTATSSVTLYGHWTDSRAGGQRWPRRRRRHRGHTAGAPARTSTTRPQRARRGSRSRSIRSSTSRPPLAERGGLLRRAQHAAAWLRAAPRGARPIAARLSRGP